MPTLPHTMPNFTSLTGAFQYANTITGDLFGAVMVLAVWAVVFLSLSNEAPQKSLTTASFFSFLLATILWATGIAGATALIAAVLAVASTSAYLFFTKPQGY